MVRIGQGVYPDEIVESSYFRDGQVNLLFQKQYRIDSGASDTMKNCLMYKLSYYRFSEINHGRGGVGYDTVREAHVGVKQKQ